MKKKILILIISIVLITGLTFSGRFIFRIDSLAIRSILLIIVNLCMGLVGFLALRLNHMRIDWEWKSPKQFLIGIGIAVGLSILLAWIPALLGSSLVGNHEEYSFFKLMYELFFYILVIGPVEELVFRVYIQDTLVSFFERKKWIGILLASAVFGLWHIINGSWLQVLFTFGIGAVFGFSKYYIKDLHYPGIALCHGFYDFLIYIVRITIV